MKGITPKSIASKSISPKKPKFKNVILKGSDIPDSKFNKTELNRGMKHESEHTNIKPLQKAIAKVHLRDDPNYNKKLDIMEKVSLKDMKKIKNPTKTREK